MATDLTVANTIRAQIGQKALAMLGARNFMGDKDALIFEVQGSPTKIRRVLVRLDSADTYTIEYWAIRKRGGMIAAEQIAGDTGVYAEDLARLIGITLQLRVSL